MILRISTTWALAVLLVLGTVSSAQAWEWLRSSNENVDKGNEKMASQDHKGALEFYDKAARELPSAGGVHLNRGLALMAAADVAAARDALLMATDPSSSKKVRADAYYNLGISFYKEADEKAAEENHEEAQKLFREASDSFKRSLMIRPGNANAAWNMELAKRRENEQELKKKQKQQQEQQQQQQQDQQEQQQDQQDGQDKPQEGENKEGDKDKEQEQRQQQDQQQQQEQQKQQKQQKQEQKSQEQQSPEPTQEKQQPLPMDVKQALDALQNGEQNLERVRAHQRAARERRRPQKDW